MARNTVNSGVRITATVDNDKFLRKIDKLLKKLNKPLIDDLGLYTEWFVQSAVKKTPPNGKTAKKRPIVKLEKPWYSVEDRELKKYFLPLRGKKKLTKYANKRKDLTKYQPISYRFISKYAWLAAGERITKKPINAKMRAFVDENRIKRMKNRISESFTMFNGMKPFVRLINAVTDISRYAKVAALLALRTTERRIKGATNKRKLRKDYSGLWK